MHESTSKITRCKNLFSFSLSKWENKLHAGLKREVIFNQIRNLDFFFLIERSACFKEFHETGICSGNKCSELAEFSTCLRTKKTTCRSIRNKMTYKDMSCSASLLWCKKKRFITWDLWLCKTTSCFLGGIFASKPYSLNPSAALKWYHVTARTGRGSYLSLWMCGTSGLRWKTF